MILNDNSTQQINTLVIQLQNKITNLTNESRKLNKEISDLGSEISNLEIRVNSNSNDDADMNTEISDLEKRVNSHANDAAAMNAEIKANTEAISGKADKSHTHAKSEITDFPTSLKNPNALTVNGKTYDGSSAVNAGVQTVANGGTGVTTQADINKAFIGDLEEGLAVITDGTEFVSSYASDNGFSEPGYVNTPLRRKFSRVWDYIKDKADSIYAALSHTHTKSEITDFPTSLPANGGTADFATALEYATSKATYISTDTGPEKKLVKIGSFPDGGIVSFLLTIKRVDGKGFTGFLTINSSVNYGTYGFNGIKSDYSMYEIVNGELVFLYRNSDNSTDVYMNVPSYASVFMLIFMPKYYSDIKLEQVSGFSGTLIDKF